jgi:enamine deaminase RidA (YjgF/YER057c/UK114 family)
MNIEHLVFSDGPKRVGPFSHAVKAGGFLFVTGQMPTLPDDPTVLVTGGITDQTQSYKHCRIIWQSGHLACYK